LKQIKSETGLFLLAGIVIGLDQWTKSIVRANLTPGASWLPGGLDWLAPYARILYINNAGAAFGSFQDKSWLFAILAVLISALIVYYYPQVAREDVLIRLALGLEMGGALGNAIDRILFGKVTDFISVGGFWVFNIADISVNLCVAALLLGLWFKTRRQYSEPGLESGVQEEA
jgi:signal peptidase II